MKVPDTQGSGCRMFQGEGTGQHKPLRRQRAWLSEDQREGECGWNTVSMGGDMVCNDEVQRDRQELDDLGSLS